MKRPLSHVCAIFVYIVYLLVNGMTMLRTGFDPVRGVMALLCVAQLLGAVASPRDRRLYWVGSVLLLMIVMGALFDTVLWPGYELYRQAPGIHATWPVVIVNAVVVCAFFLLPVAYACSASSRAYFGFPPRKKR